MKKVILLCLAIGLVGCQEEDILDSHSLDVMPDVKSEKETIKSNVSTAKDGVVAPAESSLYVAYIANGETEPVQFVENYNLIYHAYGYEGNLSELFYLDNEETGVYKVSIDVDGQIEYIALYEHSNKTIHLDEDGNVTRIDTNNTTWYMAPWWQINQSYYQADLSDGKIFYEGDLKFQYYTSGSGPNAPFDLVYGRIEANFPEGVLNPTPPTEN